MGAGASAAADDASRAASERSTDGIFIGPHYIYYDYDGTYDYAYYDGTCDYAYYCRYCDYSHYR